MPIIPAGYAQCNLRFTGTAAPHGSEITLGLNLAGFGAETPEDAAEIVADAYTPTVMSRLAAALVLSEVFVKFGPNDTGPSGFVTRNVPGADAGQAVPPNTAALVRKRTTLGGPRGKARLYQPGILEAQVDASGFIAAGYLIDLQSEFDEFKTNVETGALTLVVLHDAGISATPAPTQLESFAVQALCGTQRDRMRR